MGMFLLKAQSAEWASAHLAPPVNTPMYAYKQLLIDLENWWYLLLIISRFFFNIFITIKYIKHFHDSADKNIYEYYLDQSAILINMMREIMVYNLLY